MILVVDDFSVMRKIVKNTLKEIGFKNFMEAKNGEDAYNILLKGRIDFVISDWKMPVMDGYELLQKVRGNESLKDIPILMVTAETEKDNVLAALKAGVNNYIIKPFSPELINEKINHMFCGKQPGNEA